MCVCLCERERKKESLNKREREREREQKREREWGEPDRDGRNSDKPLRRKTPYIDLVKDRKI